MDLKEIKTPADIKGLDVEQLSELCTQIRQTLLDRLSRRGGHIGPNLGMVEMTVALHYVFDSPSDKIVFDVSHQCYTHKILTGRAGAFVNPSEYGSVSGFTNPKESEHDFFCIGHTSTAASLASGLAKARDMKGANENIIAVIGDGSLSGGEAFEGLDYAATLNSNFIAVINDNDMSIAPNCGGIYANLQLLRSTDGTAECNFFKSMGFDYKYVAYGNDLRTLIDAFESVKGCGHPVVLHIRTQKGKGFAPAEAHMERFHYGGPFDKSNGNPLNISSDESYTEIFTKHMLDMMKQRPDVAVITAGTPGAIGFGPEERSLAGSQFIDVGIAEQDAVGMASGMAKGGVRPVFGVVSSFLQRSYDQLSQDVAINGTPAVLNIFFGSVFGMNDATHLGWFDIPLVANIPGWVVLAPRCKEEYLAMLDWAVEQREHPVAIRVPGGSVLSKKRAFDHDYSRINKFEIMRPGSKVAIIATGTFHSIGEDTADLLASKGIEATLVNPRYISGLDEEMLREFESNHSLVITLEDGCLAGGFGEKVAAFYGTSAMRVACYGLPKEFRDRYSVADLLNECRLTPQQIADDTEAMLKILAK